MTTSNATLASLWIDDGQSGSMNSVPSTPVKVTAQGIELKEDVLKYYKEVGLEPVAKEVGIIDANGDLAGFKDQSSNLKTIQMIQVPIPSSPARSPFKMDQPQLLPKTVNANAIIGTPQRVINAAHIITNSPRTPQLIATPIQMDSPGWNRKRTHEYTEADFSDGKRGKKGDKGGKGLRHFSMKVCEKVQKKGTTSYNEVADELVAEFSDPRNMSPSDQVIFSKAYDQKNIRRRVYDALNVLMAMNIISKEKKEIKWIGLPTNSAQECQNLEVEKQRRIDRIKHKTQQLQELILQQIAFKNLVQRNRELEKTQGPPTANSAIQLPFIIVNTSKKTVIDCSISNDKYEYLFNFDNTFEIHDDIEVLKRMGMAYGLEKGQSNIDTLKKAVKMVPKSLESYVIELANANSSSTSIMAGPSGIRAGNATGVSAPSRVKAIQPSALTQQLLQPVAVSLDSTDAEVALAVGQGLSRQSSLGSFSDIALSRAATDTPSEAYSEDSESDRSSPVDMN